MTDKSQTTSPTTAAILGPWVAESGICGDTEERGLAVIAVLPELEQIPRATPTRGMVAWVHSGFGACETDAQAVATGRLIAAAPDLLAAVKFFLNDIADEHPRVEWDENVIAAVKAVNKAEGRNEHAPT